MKRRRYKPRRLHAVSDIHCECCKPDSKFKLIPAEQIVSSTVADDTTYSLKVYTEAYYVAMQELAASPSAKCCAEFVQLVSRR